MKREDKKGRQGERGKERVRGWERDRARERTKKGRKRGVQERKARKKIQQKYYFTGIYICLSMAQMESLHFYTYS